nr:hypothetical protein [uncultured Prevotella sp.]
MRKFNKWFGFMMAMLIMILSGGSSYAMAETPPATPNDGSSTGPIDGPGVGGKGPKTQAGSQHAQEQMGNFDYYMAYVNPAIVELKLESCPIDQILRAAKKTTPVDSNRIEYYSIGQRKISSTLSEKVTAGTTGTTVVLKVANTDAFDVGDVIMVPDVMGYKDDGTTRSTMIPLQFRVIDSDVDENPICYALNGKKNASKNNRYDYPEIPQNAVLIRLGRAAGEMEPDTGSYYSMPDKSWQYCQRFIMMVEQSIIDRMSKTQVQWTFTRQEKMAMDDMRYGQERSGLFGYRQVSVPNKKIGAVYTMGGIFWEAGKDIEIGHWQPKVELDENGEKVAVTTTVTVPDSGGSGTKQETRKVYEYVISEKDLTRFIAAILKDAGNSSRTKLLFVDNLIYQAFANLRSTRRIITETEKDYQGWKLDFETFTSMGTKIMIYRHDSFNYWGMQGRAFCLDERYLDKYVFGPWKRKEYNLDDLLIRNSEGVKMEEYSCWVLTYPNAHARVSRPAFNVDGAVTDEEIAA